MSAPLVPSPLDYIGARRFAFYPAIKNADPNEWVLGTGSRSEVQVINAQTGREIWVPRQHIGAVSDAGHSLLTVGLRKPLDLRSGSLEPRVKRVIEMPREDSDQCAWRSPSPHPAPVIAIRLDDSRKSTASKAIVGLAIGSLLACLLASLIATAARL
ncbi:MAG: hypothetical protein ACRD5Z_10605 [Bryobacteraceae bacterium]